MSMEVEIKSNNKKRRQRSWSDDPNDTDMAFQRVKLNLETSLQFEAKALSTPFMARPFLVNSKIDFSQAEVSNFALQCKKYPIVPTDLANFDKEYNGLITVADTILGHKKKRSKM